MNTIDLNQIYSAYSRFQSKWVVELSCDPIYFKDFTEHLFRHLQHCWSSRELADQVVTDLEQKSIVVYEFDSFERFNSFLQGIKGFNQSIFIVAYSPVDGKVYDSWEFFTFIPE